MQQTRASDVQAPASATPPVSGVGAVTAAPAAAVGPISEQQAEFLRARRDALSSQLRSVQGRRDEVAEALRDNETQAAERPGLEQRLKVLDQRLIQIEQEMAANSQQLANAPARAVPTASVGQRAGEGFLRRANPNLVIVSLSMILLPLAIQIARRWKAPRNPAYDRQQQAEAAALRERIDRMDGAIDAIALEVERIGEGQRFLTQAMTERVPRPDSALGEPAPALEPIGVRAREANQRR